MTKERPDECLGKCGRTVQDEYCGRCVPRGYANMTRLAPIDPAGAPGSVGVCRGARCNDPVRYAIIIRKKDGKPAERVHPFDAVPTPDGVYVIDADGFARHNPNADGPRYRSHFATCVDANSFRPAGYTAADVAATVAQRAEGAAETAPPEPGMQRYICGKCGTYRDHPKNNGANGIQCRACKGGWESRVDSIAGRAFVAKFNPPPVPIADVLAESLGLPITLDDSFPLGIVQMQSDAGETTTIDLRPPCDFAPTPRPATGPALAADGIRRADAHAPADWKITAMTAVRNIATTQAEFTADDVWARIPKPPEPSALGAIMRGAARAGIIEKSDRTRESTRPEAHSKPLPVWRSLKYRGETHANHS